MLGTGVGRRLGTVLAVALAAAALVLAAVGAVRAYRAPATRLEEQVQSVEVLALHGHWDWRVLVAEGNAAWPAGTTLAPDRPLYPYAGRTTLVSAPVIEVVDHAGSGAEVALRYEALLRSVTDGAAIWERPLAERAAHFRLAPGRGSGTFRGDALSLVMSDLKQTLDEVNRDLGLLDRYQADLLLRLTVTARTGGATAELTLASPVSIRADGFSLPPAELREGQERVQLERRQAVTVTRSITERLFDQSAWFAGAAVALACAWALLALRRRRPIPVDPAHRRYRNWIVPGRVDLGDDGQRVEVESLRGLVTIAQEAGCRVIHDPRVGYVVADRGVQYVFRPGRSPRLGEFLVEHGTIGRADVEAAVRSQFRLRRPLGECLLALGLVDEATVYCALARQHGLVYPEPDEWSPELPPRLPVPARRLGQLPDGVTVVAVADPAVPPGLLAEAWGQPVHLVLARPGALLGLTLPDPDGEVSPTQLGRRHVEQLRAHGLTLAALLRACGWVDVVEPDDQAALRHALREGCVHPDGLQLALALLRCARHGTLPTLPELLHAAWRIPDQDLRRVRQWTDDELVAWMYVSRGTVTRARRLLAAAEVCFEVTRGVRGA